ncbi:DUF4276 family protein [Lentzea sp. CC55]|uniref:DUF4276 family protein n=1 Tax=Lentzea sp. CC55 TaxID=2884909 RepID=UPI0027E0BF8D|nr:DUF4276 family protein [Lentzea sp. CC55]MCG8925544.1 DUF4276 family protein [Lentzea sp. CC55]
MTVSILFLGEGISDSGLVPQVELCAARLNIEIAVTDPDLGRLRNPPGNAVADKIRASIEIGGTYDLIVVHRDADRDGHEARFKEISSAVAATAPDTPFTTVIPVRMTEAWLLTNEEELRQVAGSPKGKVPLDLPHPSRIETVPDPKKLLKEKLAIASGLSGRKLSKFNDRFSQHRRQLLERLDPTGSVCSVPSWNRFISELEAGLMAAEPNSSRSA